MWAAMSWHAREQYVAELNRRERSLRRQVKSLSVKRSRYIKPPPPVLPVWDPARNMRDARELWAAMPREDPEVIRQRHREIEEAVTHLHRKKDQ